MNLMMKEEKRTLVWEGGSPVHIRRTEHLFLPPEEEREREREILVLHSLDSLLIFSRSSGRKERLNCRFSKRETFLSVRIKGKERIDRT
jgi:hypothetical protein